MEPFPKPNFEEIVQSMDNESFDYKQAIHSFLSRTLNDEIKEVKLYAYDKEALKSKGPFEWHEVYREILPPSCEAYKENGAILIVEGGEVYLFASVNFFQRVNNWLQKNYGDVKPLSVKRWLEELEALKKRKNDLRDKVKLCGKEVKGYKVRVEVEVSPIKVIKVTSEQ